MILYGMGGHARVVAGILADCAEIVSLFFDDDPTKRSFNEATNVCAYNSEILTNDLLIIAIGDNLVRQQIARQVSHDFGNAVHTSSIINSVTSVGRGTVITQRAVVQNGCRIGNHVIVNTGAIVEHDSTISDFVHIAPGAVLCGNVAVGERTFIGAGATILPNITIGPNSIIGAGSVVTRDVPKNTMVAGNPAAFIRRLP
jgi:sugar O-acyltransferase (sialic acid O-acetyltransferase NeuD family)